MNEVWAMWRNTRMVVLVAVVAALYVVVLLPFKVLTIVPGFTELRPATVVPVVCSMFFGPAAAWGAAFGNLIGDMVGGMFGPGSLFGFVGNFFYGLIPYKIWRLLYGEPVMPPDRFRGILGFVFATVTASAACAMIIGWGLDLLGLVPYAVLANIVAFNNVLFAGVLGPVLFVPLSRRVRALGLTYTDLLASALGRSRLAAWTGLALVAMGSLGGFLGLNAVALGFYDQTLPALVQEEAPAATPAAASPASAAQTTPAPPEAGPPVAAPAVARHLGLAVLGLAMFLCILLGSLLL